MNNVTDIQPLATVLNQWGHDISGFLTRPITIIRNYKREDVRPDLVAGLTVAIVMLPQAIAYALVAELPPQMGLYAAIIATIIGALWGSSYHLHTGPTNTTSLIVLSGLLTVAVPGTPEYLVAAGVMAVWVGVIRLFLGLIRMGFLANFVSDAVVIGFTGGAGILIVVNQLKHLFRVEVGRSPLFFVTLREVAGQLTAVHSTTLAIGIGMIIFLILLKRFKPNWPAPLLGMVVASIAVMVFNLEGQGVIVLGKLPQGLPPVTRLPIFDLDLLRQMISGIFAVAIIGLVEATSISRAIAAKSGQYLDSDQEFVGQGIANLVTGFFSGYPCSGSLTRSLVNYEAGSRTQMGAVFSGLFVLAATLLFGPWARFLPRAALAGLLVYTGSRMLNHQEMRRIWHTSRGDSAIMVGTLAATLLLPLEVAVLTGVVISFARFIAKTSHPAVHSMTPNEEFDHLTYRPEQPVCPQLGILTIEGSLYFGATQHVEDAIRENQAAHPGQRFLLLRMNQVNFCDITGLHLLETIVRLYRQQAGDVFMVGVREAVWEKMRLSGFTELLGIDHFLSQQRAVKSIFEILDPAICIYRCPHRIWRECQSLPKSDRECAIDAGDYVPVTAVIPNIAPTTLWQRLNNANPPAIVDIREPYEFEQAHIPQAELIPMPNILSGDSHIPEDQEIVLICRTGRRTRLTVYKLQQQGYNNLVNMDGGMVAWEAAGLPAVIE
ncbi:MAG: STAS domain-containing protein [Anaerolineales bacterium]|nr:STAS domain-containing protein [Anaerolineales bacterium]